MFYLVTSMLALYFLTGALVIFVINKKRGGAKERWTKFAVYFVIVYGIIGLLYFLPAAFPLLASLLVLAGYWELIKVKPKLLKSRLPFLTALGVYTGVSALFVYFSCSQAPVLLAWLYMLVLTFDGFSQLAGQLFGRLKLAGRISPGKTLEGLIGGLLMTALTAFILKPYVPAFSASSYWLLVILLAAAAFAGDLLASAYKRKAGVKDYSRLIPGHGGVLDRFDSLLGAAAGYMLFLYFF